MANANPPLEFTGEQHSTIRRLAGVMTVAAAVLLLLAGVNIVGGALALLTIPVGGALSIVEGLVVALLGLIMLSSATDVRYMAATKFATIHLGNTFRNLGVFFTTLLVWIAVSLVRLFVG